ncbi:hypothetical protein D3C87_189260 [compost metagenome]
MMKSYFTVKVFIAGLVLGAVLALGFGFYAKMVTTNLLPELFTEDIEDRFYAYATQITGKQNLYVARLQQTEVIERSSKAKALWFNLPTMILRAEAPVEYNYFLNLSAGWKFNRDGETFLVSVPELGSSTPAVDIAKLRFVVAQGSLLRNEKAALARLNQELPGLLVDRAIEHRELVREQARESAETFIRTWVAQVTGREFTNPILILFPGESPESRNITLDQYK